jgi:hypothetical protein
MVLAHKKEKMGKLIFAIFVAASRVNAQNQEFPQFSPETVQEN